MTALEIFKQLEKTNCGKCNVPTCMAFAVLVAQGNKKLKDCPYLDIKTIERYSDVLDEKSAMEQRLQEIPSQLTKKIKDMDFPSAAKRLGAVLVNDSLVIKCLGRDFTIDRKGRQHSECHYNIWIYVPLLNYVLFSEGKELTGEWIKFDQLRDAASFSNFFYYKCEDVLRRIADEDAGLFFDILNIFGAKPVEQESSADYSVVIYPLPRVPFLVSYWRPQDVFESTLGIYFDRSADYNLDVESLHIIALGIVEMLKRIVAWHTSPSEI